MKITVTPNPNHGTLPASDKLGFGTVFTDHMFLMDYTDCDGWHNARIVPFGPISVSPAASVLHYGTEVFEGLKAYRRPDGEVQLFRPWENVARLNRSCDRLGLPRIDEEDGLQAIKELVKGFQEGNQFQTLLGVTGSGKTFTMANVIQALQKPTLIISHNKTLAG